MSQLEKRDFQTTTISSNTEYIPVPNDLIKPLVINERQLMTPGPTNISQRVRAAGALPVVNHMDPQFFQVLREVSAGIRYVFQTQNQYSLAITGSATCAMETAICNLLEPDDKFLVAVHGIWGERVALIGRKHGYQVIQLPVSRVGCVLELSQIEAAIEKHRPKLLYVCHGDSSTGTLQPMDGIGRVCHQYDCLLLVDAVVSLCCAPIYMDHQEIDAIYSGGQKALSGPPGVSILSLSPRAVHRLKNRTHDVDSYYMDINWLAKAWGLDPDNNHQYIYHYTPAISLMYGLREALSLVAEEGLANVIQRHRKCSQLVQQRISAQGLEFLVTEPDHRLPAIMSVIVPKDINVEKVAQNLLDYYNITIAGGLGPTAGRIWRLGFLGVNATEASVELLCRAFNEAIAEQRTSGESSKL
ncbi:alanine--glyoxylate aminotransferase-like [Oppia nitens]|uniref:alanine--glyoxylate aminotransferase-like n=1 Tax=Oppia nitens TaxID=1686743 RepID=UPI0023DA9E77|nr:alanine--glyoxylate aminotransferase-like [Oppia nitens]